METLIPELRQFIINFCQKNKIKNNVLNDLNLSTTIDLDLNIFGLTMDLFITDFVKHFNIDYSGFSWKKYGYPEETFLIGFVRLLFGYRYKWTTNLLKSFYKPKLTINNLQEALEKGKLE